MVELLSSTDLSGVLAVVDSGPGHVAAVTGLFLMWAAGRAFFR